MQAIDVKDDIKNVLFTKEEINAKVAELAARIDEDYAGKDVLLVGVLKGAIMVMADLSRALKGHYTMDWMAVSSYGSGTKSSGVVRILKDLDKMCIRDKRERGGFARGNADRPVRQLLPGRLAGRCRGGHAGVALRDCLRVGPALWPGGAPAGSSTGRRSLAAGTRCV